MVWLWLALLFAVPPFGILALALVIWLRSGRPRLGNPRDRHTTIEWEVAASNLRTHIPPPPI
jgi:hypothetical protein